MDSTISGGKIPPVGPPACMAFRGAVFEVSVPFWVEFNGLLLFRRIPGNVERLKY
jgi:hypothetical protein